MFQKIGYHLTTCGHGLVCYYGKDVDGAFLWIEFNLKTKTYCVDRSDRPKDVTVNEFNAIQKQIEELGWL